MKVLIVEDGSVASIGLRRLIGAAGNSYVVSSAAIKDADRALGAGAADVIVVVAAGTTTVASGRALAFVRRARRQGIGAPIAVLTDREGSDFVREAMRAGAQDVLFQSDLDGGGLATTLEEFRVRLGLAKDIAGRGDGPPVGAALIGRSSAMETVRRMVTLVAQSSAPVLILGDTGTGKGLVARAIHDGGPRRNEPYLAINCAATPASLMESVMFGHERGSFTGAFKRQRGHFELVGAGTILLDEVADIALDLQPKLLRAVEDRCVRPIGAEDECSFSGRILASTNANLSERMQEGRFRSDLFYRLGVLVIRMPTLADRPEDIPELLAAFAATAERSVHLTREAVAWLSERRWPGNVRELRNAVERLAVLCAHEPVSLRAVKEYIGVDADGPEDEFDRAASVIASLPGSLSDRLDTVEAAMVRRALQDAGGNRSAAARALGVHRRVIDRHAPETARPRNSRRPTSTDS